MLETRILIMKHYSRLSFRPQGRLRLLLEQRTNNFRTISTTTSDTKRQIAQSPTSFQGTLESLTSPPMRIYSQFSAKALIPPNISARHFRAQPVTFTYLSSLSSLSSRANHRIWAKHRPFASSRFTYLSRQNVLKDFCSTSHKICPRVVDLCIFPYPNNYCNSSKRSLTTASGANKRYLGNQEPLVRFLSRDSRQTNDQIDISEENFATHRAIETPSEKKGEHDSVNSTGIAIGRSQTSETIKKTVDNPSEKNDEEEAQAKLHFLKPSERAAKAAHVDLGAQLSSEDTKSKISTLKELRQLFALVKSEKSALVLSLILVAFTTATTVILPKAIGAVVDIDSSGHILGMSYNQFFTALGGAVLLGVICSYARIFLLRIVSERVVARLRARMYRRTLAQDGGFFDANKHGDLISRLGNDAIVVGRSLTNNLADGMRGLVQGIFSFAAMTYVSLELTKQMLIIVPPIALISVVYGIFIRRLSKRTQEAVGDLTRTAEERLGSIKTVQAFNGERAEMRRYNSKIRDLFKLGRKEAVIAGGYYSFNSLAGRFTMIAILGLGGRLVSGGLLSAGDLTSFFLYTLFAGGALTSITSTYTELMKGSGAATRIFELLNCKPLISSTSGEPISNATEKLRSPLTAQKAIVPLRGIVRFEDISFAYPTRPALQILHNMSLEILPGTNIAICGPSGGGKSTIAMLLLRYYKPSNGKITYDGVDISKFNLKQWREKIAIVSQEPVLFSGTIKENIAYGNESATLPEIIETARKANCQFIADLPDGLETQVGSRGTQLSGGQRQRIAIARALLRKPSILILDEATSALDGTSEIMVDIALQNLMRSSNLTTITIAHRLATIRKADIINVLGPEGNIIEKGTFTQLAKHGTVFMELMKWQMQRIDDQL